MPVLKIETRVAYLVLKLPDLMGALGVLRTHEPPLEGFRSVRFLDLPVPNIPSLSEEARVESRRPHVTSPLRAKRLLKVIEGAVVEGLEQVRDEGSGEIPETEWLFAIS